VLAFSVFFVGAALIPVVGLPAQGFSWQQFAGVYLAPALVSNFPDGQPGSFFTVDGVNFSPNTLVTVLSNDVVLGAVQTSSSGELRFLLDSANSAEGFYKIRASGSEASETLIWIDFDKPLRAKQNEGVTFALAASQPLHLVFMPSISK
jgi:hypothetical protein